MLPISSYVTITVHSSFMFFFPVSYGDNLIIWFSIFTTSVNRALADLHHQVFGVVVGEFSSLIYFSIEVRLFVFSFLFTFSSFLLSFTVNFLGSYSFLCVEAKALVNSFPRSKDSCIKRSRRHEIISLWLRNALSESMQPLLQKSHKLLCTQRLRVTILKLNLHSVT